MTSESLGENGAAIRSATADLPCIRASNPANQGIPAGRPKGSPNLK